MLNAPWPSLAKHRQTLAQSHQTLSLITLLAAMLLAPVAQAASEATPAPVAKPALTVEVSQPQSATLTERLQASGNITAWQEAVIAAETEGLRLREVLVQVGDSVQAGQVLARYATDSVQTDVQQAQAQLAAAKASLANARASAQRAQRLLEQGFLSPQGGGDQRTAEQTAQAELARAEAVLAAQQLRLRQAEVRAPDHGVIAAKQATLGAVHGRGAELFRMIRQGRLEWRAEVTAAELGRITTGTRAQLVLPSGEQITGKVRMLAPTVDLQTRKALVYVDLAPMGKSPARAGSFARGELLLGQRQALTLPQSALVRREGFAYVFTVQADSKVRQVKVQTGQLSGSRIEITQGLTTKDRVVASGASFLNDGDLVRVSGTAAR
jgi:HlyD family secretion protein